MMDDLNPDTDPIDCHALADAHEAVLAEASESLSSSSVNGATDCLRLLERIRRSGAASADAIRQPITEIRSLGHFQIDRLIGEGAQGVVYAAYDKKLSRKVALKIPRPEVTFSPTLSHRFQHEAGMAAKLDHPNVVAVFEAGEIEGVHFIASALCDGPTLERWLHDNPSPVPAKDAAHFVAILADALSHAHSRGVIHRDIKPSNILLAANETIQETPPRLANYLPKIMDFGLGRIDGSVGLTTTGAVVGTPAYMSPEQAAGTENAVGTSVDVYALGTCLYRLLSGRLPFEQPSVLQTLNAVQNESPVSPRDRRSDLSHDVNSICMKCLEKDPQHRYATANELSEDLGRFLQGKPVHARPMSHLERLMRWGKRNPAAAALWAVLGAVLAATAIGGPIAAARFAAQRDQIKENLSRALQAEAELKNTVSQLEKELFIQSQLPRIDALSAVVKNNPAATQAVYLRGTEYWRLERYEEAITDFQAVIKVDPKHANARCDLAWIYLLGTEALRDNQRALELSQIAETHSLENWSVQCTRALALARAGRYQAAFPYAQRTMKLRSEQGTPPNTLHEYLMAIIHAKLGNPKLAREHYDRGNLQLERTRWELPQSEIEVMRIETENALFEHGAK